jgi:putative peptide zinc metalloprotease protein
LTAFVPLICLLIVLLCIPVPLYTLSEGVVWVEENSQVRAGTDCFIREILVPENVTVHAGDPLILCEDPFLTAELKELQARELELQSCRHAEPLQNTVQRDIWGTKITVVQAELDRTRERQEQLIIRSPGNGLLIFPDAQNQPGRFVRQGAMLGYIMNGSATVARVVVPQSVISLILQKTRAVELRMVDQVGQVGRSSISRATPAAGYQLPSPVLGTAGGGRIPVDPDDPEGLRSLEKVFQFDLRLPEEQQPVMLGKRVYVRFDLGRESLIGQWYRAVRGLFLQRFNV